MLLRSQQRAAARGRTPLGITSMLKPQGVFQFRPGSLVVFARNQTIYYHSRCSVHTTILHDWYDYLSFCMSNAHDL